MRGEHPGGTGPIPTGRVGANPGTPGPSTSSCGFRHEDPRPRRYRLPRPSRDRPAGRPGDARRLGDHHLQPRPLADRPLRRGLRPGEAALRRSRPRQGRRPRRDREGDRGRRAVGRGHRQLRLRPPDRPRERRAPEGCDPPVPLRLHHLGLRDQRHARRRRDRRGRHHGGSDQRGGEPVLRPAQGAVRAGDREGLRRPRHDRASRPHRRPRRQDRPIHVLAGPLPPRRRGPGAGQRRPLPVHRRPRPGRVHRHLRRAGARRHLQRDRPGRSPLVPRDGRRLQGDHQQPGRVRPRPRVVPDRERRPPVDGARLDGDVDPGFARDGGLRPTLEPQGDRTRLHLPPARRHREGDPRLVAGRRAFAREEEVPSRAGLALAKEKELVDAWRSREPASSPASID